jgi:hypothetical protein
VIIDDLEIPCRVPAPPETNPVFIVYADRMPTGTITVEGLEAIAWRRSKVIEPRGDFRLSQPPPRDKLEVLDSLNTKSQPGSLGIRIAKACDHERRERRA